MNPADLLRILTHRLPPKPGTRHALTWREDRGSSGMLELAISRDSELAIVGLVDDHLKLPTAALVERIVLTLTLSNAPTKHYVLADAEGHPT